MANFRKQTTYFKKLKLSKKKVINTKYSPNQVFKAEK